MINLGTKQVKIKNSEGNWENVIIHVNNADSVLSENSENAVQNKIVAKALNEKIDVSSFATEDEIDGLMGGDIE